MESKTLLSYFSEYRLLIAALLLLFLTTVSIQLNYNKNHMKDFTVDEYYTITTVHPDFDPSNTVYRALNGPRMFTYLFYPGALVGMIGHMGGNVATEGWDYPGHNYFVDNYSLYTSRAADNLEDPNLRYFHYYLKVQAIALVFLTLIPLVFYLWKRKYYIAMFMMATLIGINFLALEERSLFYIEPLLLSMINLLTWLYLYLFDRKKTGIFWLILSAFIIAISISLKFSSLFFIALLVILIISKSKGLDKKIQNLLQLLVLSILFFCLINWQLFYSKEVFNNVVHDYFSNFWQYATGAKAVVLENYRASNFKGMMSELFSSLGGLLYLLPIILLYGFSKLGNSERIKWGSLALIVLVTLVFIVDQRVYVDRNVLPFLPAIILVTGVMLDGIFQSTKTLNSSGLNRRRNTGYLVLLALVFLPVWIFSDNYFKTLFPSASSNMNMAITDIEEQDQRRLLTIDYDPGTVAENFTEVRSVASFPETYGAMLRDVAVKTSKEFNTSDVVLLREVKNNKQLSNYILPKLFNSNEQFADIFLFYNDPGINEDYKKLRRELEVTNSKNLLSTSVNLREDIILEEVRLLKLTEGYRLLLKLESKNILYGDLEGCRFYIHTRPYEADLEDLPEDRLVHGFEGWGFTISEKNKVIYGRTIYLYGDFNPVLKKYKNLSFGIFKGCTESEDISIEDVKLP